MVHCFFNPNSVKYDNLFIIKQTGAGYFEGYRFQRGGGKLGDFFRNVWRHMVPIAKGVFNEFGREGLTAGVNVLTGMQEGKPVTDLLKKEAAKTTENLLKTAANKVGQYGKGRRRKSTKGKPVSQKIVTFSKKGIKGHSVPASVIKKRKDIFGIY